MNRLTKGLIVGALGSFFIAPCAMAQSWQDMHNDRDAIHDKQQQIRHDRRELRNDMRRGDYGAARDEEREIREREGALQDRREDLNRDMNERAWNHRDNDDD